MENLTLRLKNRRSYAFGGLPLYSEVLFGVMIETMGHRSFFYSLGNALNRRITTAFLLGQQGNKEPGKDQHNFLDFLGLETHSYKREKLTNLTTLEGITFLPTDMAYLAYLTNN